MRVGDIVYWEATFSKNTEALLSYYYVKHWPMVSITPIPQNLLTESKEV